MLKVRLARAGRKKRAFFRIVLTEHTRPPQSGYKEVLGWFDPIKHEMKADAEKIKELITKGVQLSPRVAKILFAETKDATFEKFFEKKDVKREKRNPDKD